MTVPELCSTFEEAITDNQKRRTKAKEDIIRLSEQLVRGENPQGYRAEWMKATAMSIIDLLGEKCLAFDEAHPTDRATAMDCVNSLLSALNLVFMHLGKRIVANGSTLTVEDL